MAVYKDEKTNTWRVLYRYTGWNGERKQSQKRGFKTKREAQAWEREQINRLGGDLDMIFQSFVQHYADSHKGKHMGNQRSHHKDQAASVFRKAENEQYHTAADHQVAERASELQG